MNLVSMEISKSEADKLYGSPEVAPAEESKYPYGLKLNLDQEILEKLGLSELPKVGSKMKLMAEVEVCSASQYESKDGASDKSIGLQLTAMALEAGASEDAEEKKEDPSQALYGEG